MELASSHGTSRKYQALQGKDRVSNLRPRPGKARGEGAQTHDVEDETHCILYVHGPAIVKVRGLGTRDLAFTKQVVQDRDGIERLRHIAVGIGPFKKPSNRSPHSKS